MQPCRGRASRLRARSRLESHRHARRGEPRAGALLPPRAPAHARSRASRAPRALLRSPGCVPPARGGRPCRDRARRDGEGTAGASAESRVRYCPRWQPTEKRTQESTSPLSARAPRASTPHSSQQRSGRTSCSCRALRWISRRAIARRGAWRRRSVTTTAPRRISRTRFAPAGAPPGQSAARILCDEAPERVRELERRGVSFDSDPDSRLALGLEGGHSRRRVVHADGSATGRRIAHALSAAALDNERIEVHERSSALRLWVENGSCVGVVTDRAAIPAAATLLATGGAAALWKRTTNPPGAVGAGLLLAYDAGAALADLELLQFHPTALVADGPSGRLSRHGGRAGRGRTPPDLRATPVRRRARAPRRGSACHPRTDRAKRRSRCAARHARSETELPQHRRDSRPGAVSTRAAI